MSQVTEIMAAVCLGLTAVGFFASYWLRDKNSQLLSRETIHLCAGGLFFLSFALRGAEDGRRLFSLGGVAFVLIAVATRQFSQEWRNWKRSGSTVSS